MSIFLLFGLVIANEHFKKPWAFAGIYSITSIILTLLFPSKMEDLTSSILSAGVSFILVGFFLTLLLRFEDSVFKWLATLVVGLLVISGGAGILLSLVFP
jgi:hypothetical protein